MDGPNNAKKGKPWQLIAILAITIVPIIAAYVAYYTGLGVPQDTVNEGTLLSPAKNLQDLLSQASGQIPGFEHNKKWRIIVPVSDSCNQQCQQHLYLTRQVHVRLGDKADRVERYAVNLAGVKGESYLQSIAAEHPKLKSFNVPEMVWRAWLKGSNAPQDLDQQHFVLLIDQVGFAMMFYDQNNDGNQMLKDIKRVLRYSPE